MIAWAQRAQLNVMLCMCTKCVCVCVNADAQAAASVEHGDAAVFANHFACCTYVVPPVGLLKEVFTFVASFCQKAETCRVFLSFLLLASQWRAKGLAFLQCELLFWSNPGRLLTELKTLPCQCSEGQKWSEPDRETCDPEFTG